MIGITSQREAAPRPVHPFTRIIRIFPLLALAATTGCTPDPGQALGKSTLSDVVARESGGALAVATFSKSNGIKRQVAGQGIYALEYSSILKFASNGWKGGNAFEGQFSDFRVATAQPGGFGAFGKEWNYFDAGDQVEITGDITYESTEKGWRPGTCQQD